MLPLNSLPPLPRQPDIGRPTQQNNAGLSEEDSLQQLGKTLREQRQQQLKDMRNGMEQAREAQKARKTTQPATRKAASQRAALLKQRLDALKAVMAKLPPGDYKVLAQEVKQIAKELAALGKQLGKSSGGNAAVALPPQSFAVTAAPAEDLAMSAEMDAAAMMQGADSMATVMPVEANLAPVAEDSAAAVEESEDVAEAPPAEAQHLAAQAEAALQHADNRADNSEDTQKPPLQAAGPRSAEDNEERELRALLADARKSLKEVLALLKAKHLPQDKESKKLLQDIEKELASLEQELQRSSLDEGLDNSLSAADTGSADIAGEVTTGSFIDISV